MSDVNDAMRLTKDGDAKANSWKLAQTTVVRMERDLSAGRIDLREATQSFGRWLMPPDARVGEAICVWMGDTLVRAEMTQQTPPEFKIDLRYKGRGWDKP